MASNYGPINETDSQIRDDRFWVGSSVVYGMFYGIHVCVYCVTVYFLLQRRLRTRVTWLFFAFSTTLLGTGTVVFSGSTKLLELMFVDNRNYPGGPSLWYVEVGQSTRWIVVSNAAYFFSELFADALLLYRVWIVWEKTCWVMIAPVFLFLYVIALGFPIMCVPSLTRLWFITPLISSWFGTAAALNGLLTLLIAVRLIIHSRSVRKTLGYSYTSQYISIVEIVVESAATYAILQILFITFYSRGDDLLANALTWPVLTQAVGIAPDMIILRGALRSYTGTPTAMDMSSAFASRGGLAFSATAQTHDDIQLQSVGIKIDVNQEVVQDSDRDSGRHVAAFKTQGLGTDDSV